MNILILLGPPGSGKGTQATALSEKLDIPHISTGDLFRENIRENTALGTAAKGFIEAGNLVPDELVLEMLFNRIQRPDCAKGFLLDGSPRTIPQAKAIDKLIASYANPSLKVLNLAVGNELITKRAEGRLTCKQCGHVYNKYSSPPKVEGQCDLCQGELFQRPDDRPEVVLERLRVYEQQTKPLIDYYKEKNVLITVDGEGSKEAVYALLLKALT